MRPEDLMDAFQYLDDDMIESADLLRNHVTSVKYRFTKFLAQAACICLIFTGIYGISVGIFKTAGSADKSAQDHDGAGEYMEDIADGSNEKEAGNRGMKLTLPDYEALRNAAGDDNSIEYYSFLNTKTEGESFDDSSMNTFESLICTLDVLPVYTGLHMDSSYMVFDDLGILEKELGKITSYSIYNQYFYIDANMAISLLKEGRYITFTSAQPDGKENYNMVLVYLYDGESDLAVPYYHFYDKDIEITDDISLLHQGWFVPAIEESYITNMPG